MDEKRITAGLIVPHDAIIKFRKMAADQGLDIPEAVAKAVSDALQMPNAFEQSILRHRLNPDRRFSPFARETVHIRGDVVPKFQNFLDTQNRTNMRGFRSRAVRGAVMLAVEGVKPVTTDMVIAKAFALIRAAEASRAARGDLAAEFSAARIKVEIGKTPRILEPFERLAVMAHSDPWTVMVRLFGLAEQATAREDAKRDVYTMGMEDGDEG